MEQSFRKAGGMRYGPGSPWERHDESDLAGSNYCTLEDVLFALKTSSYFARLDGPNSLDRRLMVCDWLIAEGVLMEQDASIMLADLAPPKLSIAMTKMGHLKRSESKQPPTASLARQSTDSVA
jgi:hypothetical protein